ncbi:MAG TPA: P-loop NTPase fold protein, partial [bacterium]
MSERNVFPEPATTKGGGDTMPEGRSGDGQNTSPGAARRRLALWLVTALVIGTTSLYGLFLDRSIRPDPFARAVSLSDWLLHPQPHPALARIPVVPIGAIGTLTFRPAETGWINTQYLPGSEAASAQGDAPRSVVPFTVGLISTAHAADAPPPRTPTQVAPPNAPVLDPDLLKKGVSERVAKEPPTYAAPAQQTAEQAVRPPAVASQTVAPAQEEEPPPVQAAVDEPAGPPRILHAQFLPDGRRGWVAGETPGILATEDGGESWTDLGSASLGRVRAFAFEATGQSGWAFTTRGTFSTGDGGRGWPSPNPALGPSDLATHWHFNEGYWTDVGEVRLRVTPAERGTAAPIPVAGGELFTTAAGEVFEVASAAGADTAAIAERAAGQAWQMGTEPGRFHAVLFVTSDGETTAWAVGDGGALVRITGAPDDRVNAGNPWTARETPTQANLRSLYFQPDGRIGWAASGWEDGNEGGKRPVILQTTDGGATWQRLPYRHLPAPWLFLALPALVLTGYRTATTWLDLRATPPRRASVADQAASDSPIGWEDRDALGLQAIARALSKFVRNRNTVPPLTFAVSGPWGTGKSSLMNLVAEDLRTFGTRPVWFNAWHHQKEEHLLAALLEAIRSEAIPSWWQWSGLSFRLRLLWRRVRSDLQSALAVGFLAVVVVVAFQLLLELDDFQEALAALTDSTFGEWLTGALLGQLTALGSFGAGLYAVSLALLKLRVITLNPAQLMASLRDRSRISDLRDQLGFRHRFDREFNTVCHALRTRRTAGMVILIDDLDRCQPDNVLAILEAVNYLATAGPCFIFLGIDTE